MGVLKSETGSWRVKEAVFVEEVVRDGVVGMAVVVEVVFRDGVAGM
jgi:hypothetical protein